MRRAMCYDCGCTFQYTPSKTDPSEVPDQCSDCEAEDQLFDETPPAPHHWTDD